MKRLKLFFEKLETFGMYGEGWKTRLKECVCDLLCINDDFRVKELQFHGCFEQFVFHIVQE